MADNEVSITVNSSGPYIVEGKIKMVDADGNHFQIEGDRTALCRCGESSKKPFCDGTHRSNGFDALTKAS